MKRFLQSVFWIFAVLYIPSLLILPILPPLSKAEDMFGNLYGISLLLLFLYTIPLYCAFLEIGAAVRWLSDRKRSTVTQTVAEAISLVLTVGMLAAHLSQRLSLALAMTTVWVLLRISCAIVFRGTRQRVDVIRSRWFWLGAAVTFLALCGIVLAVSQSKYVKGVPDAIQTHSQAEKQD